MQLKEKEEFFFSKDRLRLDAKCSVKIFKPTFQYFVYICHCICDNFSTPAAQKANDLKSLLLGSMYFWSWLIQLNRSYQYNGKFARTGISTLNSHISKTVTFFEKLKKIMCNSILGLYRWFQNFLQCVFCHFWLIWVRFWSFFGC